MKKSTCERYDIRWDQWGWAIITIDENGGVFNAQSDYGSYAYSWPNHGRKSFKHFILELARDKSYFLGKVAKQTYFNYEKHLGEWKRKIIEMRRDRDCTKENARDAWEVITGLDDYSSSHQLIEKELYESDIINELSFGEPWYVFETDLDYSPQALAFAQEVMPMFAEILKKEIPS